MAGVVWLMKEGGVVLLSDFPYSIWSFSAARDSIYNIYLYLLLNLQENKIKIRIISHFPVWREESN